MSRYPVKRLVVPKELKKVGNGLLEKRHLRPTFAGGDLYVVAAQAFNAMFQAAVKDGIRLKSVGDYRTLKAQESLFFQRYSLEDLGRKPQVTRIYKRKKYYLKPGYSPAATPGTSNHGWGLAIDIDLTNPKVFPWLCRNAPKYGFYLQGKPRLISGRPNPEYEPWHWQKVNA